MEINNNFDNTTKLYCTVYTADIKNNNKDNIKRDLLISLDDLSFSYEELYEDDINNVFKGRTSGIVKKAETIVNAFSSYTENNPLGSNIPKYSNIKGWSGTGPISSENSIKFMFHFGMKGEFDAKKEVVDNMLDFIKVFAPTLTNSGRIKGVIPNTIEISKAFIESALDSFSEFGESTSFLNNLEENSELNFSSDLNNKDSGFINSLVKFQNNTYQALDSAIEKSLTGNSDNVRLGYLILSKDRNETLQDKNIILKIGPFIVGSIKYSFNYSTTDKDGYPLEGFVELENLQYITMATQTELANIFPNLLD